MTTNIAVVIIINLGILLVAALAFSSYLATKAASTKNKLLRKLQHSHSEIDELKSELRRLRISKRESEKSSQDITQELSNSLDSSQKALGELASLQESQASAISNLEPLLDKNLDDSEDVRALKVQISKLKAQSHSSNNLVTDLKKNLESNRYRMQSLEEKLAKRKDDSNQIKTLQSLEQQSQLENKQLCEKVEEQAKKLAAYLKMEREVGALRQENRSMELASQEQTEQLKQQADFIAFQEALKSAESSEGDITNSGDLSRRSNTDSQALQKIQSQLEDVQDELSRAMREKDFIESQFLDVLASLESATDLEGELARAKKEYTMLEDNYLLLANADNPSASDDQAKEQNDDDSRFDALDNSDISLPKNTEKL